MYDVIAIGCGPFNLGLAALADGVDDVQLAVLDSRPEFTWHRGLMSLTSAMKPCDQGNPRISIWTSAF